MHRRRQGAFCRGCGRPAPQTRRRKLHPPQRRSARFASAASTSWRMASPSTVRPSVWPTIPLFGGPPIPPLSSSPAQASGPTRPPRISSGTSGGRSCSRRSSAPTPTSLGWPSATTLAATGAPSSSSRSAARRVLFLVVLFLRAKADAIVAVWLGCAPASLHLCCFGIRFSFFVFIFLLPLFFSPSSSPLSFAVFFLALTSTLQCSFSQMTVTPHHVLCTKEDAAATLTHDQTINAPPSFSPSCPCLRRPHRAPPLGIGLRRHFCAQGLIARVALRRAARRRCALLAPRALRHGADTHALGPQAAVRCSIAQAQGAQLQPAGWLRARAAAQPLEPHRGLSAPVAPLLRSACQAHFWSTTPPPTVPLPPPTPPHRLSGLDDAPQGGS